VMTEYNGPGYQPGADGVFLDFWHVPHKYVQVAGGAYPEPIVHPLSNAVSLDEVEAWPWPDPDWFDYSHLYDLCREYKDYCIVAGTPGAMDLVNGLGHFRGFGQALIDFVTQDPVGMAIVDKRFWFWHEWCRRCLEACRGEVDILHIGDDYGTQTGPVMSPEQWRTVAEPYLRKMVHLAHEHGALLMLHSCGSTRLLMEDFVRVGVDILDTVQPYALNMDPAELKTSFHGRLAFHGMVSVQKVLPAANPARVEQEVEHLCAIMKPGGGFALAPTHNVQPDTPVENVLRMYEAVRKYGLY
jgi:uroporphyrinogen decarboxylase